MVTRASGKTITVAVSDGASGVAGGTISVRNSPSEPFRALPTSFANGALTAKLDRGSAAKVGIADQRERQRGQCDRRRDERDVTSRRRSCPARWRRFRGLRAVGRVLGAAAHARRRAARRTGRGDRGDLARRGLLSHRRRHDHDRCDRALPLPGARGAEPAGAVRLRRRLGLRAAHAHRAAAGARVEHDPRVPANAARRRAGAILRPARAARCHCPPLGQAGRPTGVRRRPLAHVRHRPRPRGSKGRWSSTYRFAGRPGRYPVRLRIRREDVFPYELGYSRSVVVRVR